MGKFKKINIVFAVVFIIVGGTYFTYLFINGGRHYREEQDKYFSKVEYYFSGKMHSYRLLGGVTYLIEIDVDSVSFTKNNISYKNDFVGLYSETQGKIFFNADFDTDTHTNKSVVSDTLPYVRVNSSNRTIEYITDKETIIETLNVSGFYLRDLKKTETKEMIRF